ncbi:MAG: hypothetical protein FRX49_10746 [Trebouxia sp. A1-2]|nr:MAG: hypothetical protein FRX49_10746 [Trebouxia sp. A1-2]
MLRRLGHGSCWAKAASEAAFSITSERAPLTQNSVTTQTGFRHRPMNMTTLGWRMAAMMDTCKAWQHGLMKLAFDAGMRCKVGSMDQQQIQCIIAKGQAGTAPNSHADGSRCTKH